MPRSLADTALAGCGVRPRAGGRARRGARRGVRRRRGRESPGGPGGARLVRAPGAVPGLRRRRAAPARCARPPARRASSDLAERCWYPLWDAGFVTGHGTRTVKESLALADDDLDALTRVPRRAAPSRATRRSPTSSCAKGRQLAARRGTRVLTQLADAAELRRLRPGLVAEMLEPDLKDGGGGLRDLHVADVGRLRPRRRQGSRGLETRGYVSDVRCLATSRRGATGCSTSASRCIASTGGRTDRLALQEQAAVADLLGLADADALDARALVASAREVAWISARRVVADPRPPRRVRAVAARAATVSLAEGVVLPRGPGHVVTDELPVSALRVLEAAAAAAEADAAVRTRHRWRDCEAMAEPTWDVWERAAFLRLLRAGAGAVPVFEALDHEGVLVRLLPEWEHVRSRPQRNAYHRFTVDRHLLEAVAECAALLDAGDDPTTPGSTASSRARCAGARAAAARRAAARHRARDMPGDHSRGRGRRRAGSVARRIGLDSEGREILVWLVRNHLLMAEVATRRDLSDAASPTTSPPTCAGDAERLRLLYLLTIGDSRATGPAAWGPTKAALVRDLFVKAAAAIERGESRSRRRRSSRRAAPSNSATDARQALPRPVARAVLLAFDVDEMRRCTRSSSRTRRPCGAGRDGGHVVDHGRRAGPARPARDARRRAHGVRARRHRSQPLRDHRRRRARRVPRHRSVRAGRRRRCARSSNASRAALEGEIDVDGAGRRTAPRRTRPGRERGPSEVEVVIDESDDRHGRRSARRRRGRAALPAGRRRSPSSHLDVRVAKVATLGTRVVDVFYVRDRERREGRGSRHASTRLRDTLVRAPESIGWARMDANEFAVSAVGSAALGRDALRHRAHGPRVHPEPLRAGALRRGAEGRGRHPRRRDRGSRSRRAVRGVARAPSARASPATSRRRSRSPPSSATTRARSSSRNAPTRAGGCIPVGWADVGYSPSEIAMKEVLEETGIECETVSLIAVLDGLRLGFARVPMYSLVFHCRMLGGELAGPSARDERGRVLRARRAPAAAGRRAPLARPRVPGDRRRGPAELVRPAAHPTWRGESEPRRPWRSARELLEQERDDRDLAVRAPTRRRSTRGRRGRSPSGGRPSELRGHRGERCGSMLVAVGREALEPVPETRERPGLVAEAQRVRIRAVGELRSRSIPTRRSGRAAPASRYPATGCSRHSQRDSSPTPMSQVWEPLT